jgi:sugar lactone lactonase YvrE
MCEAIPTTPGDFVATANYGGDALYGPAQASVAFTVTPTQPKPGAGAPATPSLTLDAGSDTGSSNNDRITNDDTPTLRVQLTGSGPNTHAAGDVVRIYLGNSNEVGSVTLTAANIAAGEVLVTTTSLGNDGSKSLTARVFRSSVSSNSSSSLTVVLDKTPPELLSGSITGATVRLNYIEKGSGLNSTPPTLSLFSLITNGTTTSNPVRAVVNQVNNTVTLDFASPITSQTPVRLNYTSSPSGVRDIAGNLANSATTFELKPAATTTTTQTTTPTTTTTTIQKPPTTPPTVKPPPSSNVIVTEITPAQPTTINSSAARFNFPTGIVRDKQGNLYVTDQMNYTVRKIAVNGAVTTVAGKAGQMGSQDGPLGISRFLSPGAIAVDDVGNLYVVDNRNLRKIDTSGNVTTLVTTPQNAPLGRENTFGLPAGLAVDSAGNIFVADYLVGAIWKVSADGKVSRFVSIGQGISNLAGAGPSGIALDTANNLYVCDLPYSLNAGGFSSIHKVTPSGTVTLLYGPTLGLINARGIGIDAKGDLYVNENLLIIKIAAAGDTATTYQLPTTEEEGSVSAASVAVNAESGVMYFTDSAKHTVDQMGVDGKISIIAGRTGEAGATDVEK